MYQNLKRACRAIVFAHQAFCFVALSLSSPLCFRKVPKDSIENASVVFA